MTNAKALIAPYRGKTWLTKPDAAAVFQHEPAALPIRFFDASDLHEHLVEGYSDELTFQLKAVEDDEWTDESLVPIAAIGYPNAADIDDDEDFLGGAFAFLLFDSKARQVIVTTTDHWSRDNVLDGGLAALGLSAA